MAHLAHALLCDACSDPIAEDEEPIVVPGPGPVEHFHRDPECAPLEEVSHGDRR